MRLTNAFTVPAPPDRVWAVLLDVGRVAPCLPGAALESSDGDEHTGTMTVKLGPVTSRYAGTVRIEEADQAARRAVMRAEATDARRKGAASATITSVMEPVEGGTRVVVETDLVITGPVAQFGQGVMQDVSSTLMRQFAERLAQQMSDDEPDAPETEAAAEAGARPPSALDLNAAARDAVLKRAVPAVGGLMALGILALLLRRR
jgi:carbon monoxide dehydrogenase subunit G